MRPEPTLTERGAIVCHWPSAVAGQDVRLVRRGDHYFSERFSRGYRCEAYCFEIQSGRTIRDYLDYSRECGTVNEEEAERACLMWRLPRNKSATVAS